MSSSFLSSEIGVPARDGSRCGAAERNPRGDLFEVDRVISLLDEHRHQSPAQQISAVREAMLRWQGKREPVDDQTVVIIQRNDI